MRLFDLNLDGAILIDADLTGTSMKRCKGLTQCLGQQQIEEAVADSNNPSKPEGVVDAITGKTPCLAR